VSDEEEPKLTDEQRAKIRMEGAEIFKAHVQKQWLPHVITGLALYGLLQVIYDVVRVIIRLVTS